MTTRIASCAPTRRGPRVVLERLGSLVAPIGAVMLAFLPGVYLPFDGASSADALAGLARPKIWWASTSAVLLATCAWARLRTVRGRPARQTALLVPLAAFLGWYALSAGLSGRPESFHAMQQVFTFAAVLWVTATVPRAWTWVLPGLLGAGALAAAIIVLQVYGLELPGWRPTQDMALPAGTFFHRNAPAYLIALALPVASSGFASARRRRSMASYALLVALLAGALLMTGCRGAWIAATVACASVVVAHRQALRRDARTRLSLAAVAAVAVWVGMAGAELARHQPAPAPEAPTRAAAPRTPAPPAVATESLAERANIVRNHGSLRKRMYLWRAGVSMAAERPWLGVGPGGFRFDPRAVSTGRETAHDSAHNEVINTAAEAGIPAALLLLALAAAVVWRWSVRVRERGWAPEAAVGAILLVLALMSCVEVVIRTAAHSAVAGAVLGCAVSPSTGPTLPPPGRWPIAAAALGLVGSAAAVLWITTAL